MVTVECILTHELGHSQKVVMFAPPDATGGKNPIQAIKSTRTYLKRSTFEDVTGAVIDDADDDGHGYSDGVETITDEQLAHPPGRARPARRHAPTNETSFSPFCRRRRSGRSPIWPTCRQPPS